MVNLDIDVELLAKYAYLLQQANGVNSTSGSKGAQGTQEAGATEKFYEQDGYSAKQLVEDLDLRDPKNRFALIKLMKQSDVMSLLPFLDKKSLINGMKFFSKDKLSIMLSYIPENELSKMLFSMYNSKDIMSMLPIQTVRKFLKNDKIEKKMVMQYFSQMQPKELKEMYKEATGIELDTNNKGEILAKMNVLKPDVFKDLMQAMEPKEQIGLAAFLVHENPKLLQEISGTQLSYCFDKSTKVDILDGMEALEPDTINKMLTNLPPELMDQVVTQIDPEIFADQLLNNFTDVLDKLIGG